MKILFYLLTLLLLFSHANSRAQTMSITPEMQENVLRYNMKINELIETRTQNGFNLIQEEKLPIRSDIDMVVHIPLHEGNWYHFCFIGDPSSEKIKAALFLEGDGDFIQDRIIVQRDKEFWTEFSFACQYSGNYELTLYQKADIARPLSYLTIFKKN